MTVRPVRLAVIRDFRAENWPSMDLCADQLLGHLAIHRGLEPSDVETPFRRRFQRMPIVGGKRAAFNADRVINRHLVLPRVLRRHRAEFDFFHVVDHSYAQVVHALPAGRAGVYCHDLDVFRSLLEPERETRPSWFRKLAQRTLDGLKLSAVVFYNSRTIGHELIKWGIVPPERLVHAPLGVAAEFTPDSLSTLQLPVRLNQQYLLHVGSSLPRKRLDILLDVFAAVRKRSPDVRLIQVGGPWPKPLADQLSRLGIESAVTQVRGLSREQLAELYRRSAGVLVTSDSEGFGLPVIEALGCGAPVVASDIPVLREVGGMVVDYCAVGDIPAWTEAVVRILSNPTTAYRDERLAHASRYSWREHARIIAETYLQLAAGLPPRCASSS